MKKVRILAFQYLPIYLDMNANLKKMERLLKNYSYLAPDLVIFPEYAISGPLYSHYGLALKDDSKQIKDLSGLAKKFSIFLIPGSFVRKSGQKLFNSTCLFNREGHSFGFYDKQCLWSSEKRFLQQGRKSGIFSTEIGNIGLQICADLHSSKISASYRNKADIIANVSMWSHEDMNSCTKKAPASTEYNQTEYLSRARAIENRCFFVFCNFGGKFYIKASTGRRYSETSIGNSMVISPFGEVIASISGGGASYMFCEVDIKKSHWNKTNF